MKSWTALLKREYLEHRIPFLWFPLGIVTLLVLSGLSALGLNRLKLALDVTLRATLKFFELGYLATAGLWWFYLGIALFFYFGDAFNADRRNNAMFFWKSMPVSDFKILGAKFLTGMLLFPAIIFVVALVTGVLHLLLVNIAVLILPSLVLPPLPVLLMSYVQISAFMLAYLVLSLLWYAPFFAWVGGLSTVFGRWSLALAFVIPGVLSLVENIVTYGNGPRGGYLWSFIAHRMQFGLTDTDYSAVMLNLSGFDASAFVTRLVADIDWLAMGEGLVFSLVVIYLASEYRRRRIA